MQFETLGDANIQVKQASSSLRLCLAREILGRFSLFVAACVRKERPWTLDASPPAFCPSFLPPET